MSYAVKKKTRIKFSQDTLKRCCDILIVEYNIVYCYKICQSIKFCDFFVV